MFESVLILVALAAIWYSRRALRAWSEASEQASKDFSLSLLATGMEARTEAMKRRRALGDDVPSYEEAKKLFD